MEQERRSTVAPERAHAPHVARADDAISAAMDRYALGDQAAFAIVYDGLAARLLGFIRHRIRDSAVAEEILQQTFLQLHANRGHYVTGLDVVPWAFAIARHLVIDTLRKGDREVLVETDEPVSQAPHPDEALALRQSAAELRRRIHELPELQRSAFELVRLQGLTLAQAAQSLGTTVTAVKLRLHRATETLRLDPRDTDEQRMEPPQGGSR
jgi:RNA polymerase sigma-70 factor (ECF subfamily)